MSGYSNNMAKTENGTDRATCTLILTGYLLKGVREELEHDRRSTVKNTVEVLIEDGVNARRKARGEPPIGAEEAERGNAANEPES